MVPKFAELQCNKKSYGWRKNNEEDLSLWLVKCPSRPVCGHIEEYRAYMVIQIHSRGCQCMSCPGL